MADANELCDTIMRQLNNVAKSDTDETQGEPECFSFQEETDTDDLPPALLSYFENSKSRAAVFEKLILEEPAEFTTSHEDMMNAPIELDEDMMKLNGQIVCDSEENNTSTDSHLLPAPTETQTLSTHNVAVCPNNEDEAGRDEFMESERHLTLEAGTLEISLTGEERLEIGEYEAEREKRHCEETDKEEQRRQIERDFQKELKRLMEAEKLHQMELELMEKKAQEKLEQELQLQQELICNLRRRVEEERKLREEEQRRIKDEKEKRKQEEEKIKMEAERKRIAEETRRKEEEERRIEEMKLKKEEEEEKKRRKREDERNKIDLERKKLEDKMIIMRNEEERMRKEEKRKEKMEMIEAARKKVEEERRNEEEMNLRKEEEKKKKKMEMIEAARKKGEEERRNEEEMNLRKEEEWRTDAEERKKKESIRLKEEGRITDETEERKKQEEMRKMKEKKDIDDRKKMVQKKMYVETRMRDKGEEIEVEERKKKEENDGEGREEEEEAWEREKERKKTEEEKEVKQVVRKREGENRKMKEQRPKEEDEKRNQEDVKQIKEEEQRRRQREEVRKLRDEEDYRKSEEEIREEEERKLGKEEMRTKVEAEREQNGWEKVGENKRQVNKKTEEEEIRHKEKEESKKRMMQNREEEGRVNWLQEKTEENSTIGQQEKTKADKRENSPTCELQDGTRRTSWVHSDSAVCPSSADAITQRCDTDGSITQTSSDKTVGQAGRPSPVSLPVFLPERTEHKRLSWMKHCVSWSRLSLQNRRKQKGSGRSRRGPRRAAEAGRLPPLCPDSLLQSSCWKSPQEVTTVTLEDLPGCSLATLAQCTRLRSLTLRRCGLKSLEGIKQLPQLCYINAQENDISFVDCENMTSLRVLQLSHNKLTSIHGLTGAENLDVLHLSHNSISRIAGLESMRRLQSLSLDHNQLISTKGLRDVYTLLHLNCSYNHLASVEGLENSALLNTLDLRANSLTEPPSLDNHVLLRELHLDDNSISSLQGLAACWLPLMQHLSVAQNRITQLPSMADAVSLANLDLRFNCLSELQSVCESLRECQFLRELHLTGNPLQQESGWRSTVLRAVPGLRAIDEQEADSLLCPPAVQQVSLASGSFLTFCQAQLQQTRDLQQQHSRELSKASSSLDAVETSCRHFTEALQLSEDQRFSHEYGETTVADKHSAAGRTSEETPDVDRTNVKCTERPETESTGQVSPLIPNKDNIRCSHRTFDERSRRDTFDTVTTGPQTGPAISKANSSGSVHCLPKGSATLQMPTVSSHQDPDHQNTAAAVIQQLWRKHKQRCGNISHPSTAEKGGGDGRSPESGPSYINESIVGQDYAATVIQAFWRGFALRRRLASALAAVTGTDTAEDDTFEEVDVDEFVVDETLLEKPWTFPFPEDSPPRCYSVSEQPLSLKPGGPPPHPSQRSLPPQMLCRSKQAWVAGEQVDSAGHTVSPVSSNRSRSPPSVCSGLSRRSEKIVEEWGFTHSHTALLMLKRAQNMKSRKQQQKKPADPSVRLDSFRNRSCQPGPAEAWDGRAQRGRNYIKAREAELGPQQAERTERVKQERAQQWLHTQASRSDRDSASLHFLPEISPDILNGGRVQLVADPGYTQRLHHASGLWANSSLAGQPCKENNYPRRNSLGHARKEVPSPKRVASAPPRKERISFRDNPVQLSGGWGGGKKRDRVHK